MAGPSIQQSRNISDPSLKDLIDLSKKDIFLTLNCHALATVQSVDFDDKTISATINYQKTYFEKDEDTGAYVPVLVDYPNLIDVPFIILGGGQSGISFPIAKGDECLILFNDRDIDNWFAGATNGPVASPRLHSLADGIALVGFNFSAMIDPTRVTMYNGSAGVAVSASLIKIFNATTTLNTILQDILTQLETLANSPAVPGIPLNPGVATALATLGTQLGLLLE